MSAARELQPRIEIFNPFEKPFAKESCDNEDIIDHSVMRYMRSQKKSLEIVAKCTPCQCCACR